MPYCYTFNLVNERNFYMLIPLYYHYRKLYHEKFKKLAQNIEWR